jgi:Maf1 regulator
LCTRISSNIHDITMKYLQDDRLSAITARLLTPDLVELSQGQSAGRGPHRIGASGTCASGAMIMSSRRSSCRRVRGKIEAYTTKRTSTDKKYASHLGIKYVTSLQRHNSSVEVGVVQQPQQQQQEMTLALGLDAATPAGVLVAAGSAAAPPLGAIEKKRRAHSVGFTGDGSSGSNKKPRSRSNSLDENVLSYHTALGDFAAQETRRLMTDFVLTLNMSFPDYDFEEVSPNDFEKVPLPQVVLHVQSLLLSDATTSSIPVQQAVPTSPGLIPPDTAVTTRPGAPEQGGLNLNLNLAWKGDVDGDGSVSEFAYEVASTVDPLDDAAPGSDPSRNGSNSSNSSSNMLAELWSAMDSVIRLGDCEVYRWTNPPEGLLTGDNDDEYDADSDDDDVVTVWSFYYLLVNKSLKRIVFFCCSETLVNRHPTSASVNGDAYMDEEENGPLAGVRDDGNDDRDGLRDVDLVSEQDNGDDDEDEDGIVTSSQHYKMMMSSADASSSEADFDLDPAAVTAGGIPISTV